MKHVFKKDKDKKKTTRKKPKAAVIVPAPIEVSSEEERYNLTPADVPVIKDSSAHFNQKDFLQLHPHLPRRFWFHEPKMVFSTNLDGTSFITFYAQAAHHTPTLLIISDVAGHIFGAFTTEEYKKHPSGECVLGGTGETFLFKCRPSFETYHWSKLDEQYQLTGGTNISFGGGQFGGIWINESFCRGRSHTCDTFLNDCLASAKEFDITAVELWALIPP